jgi:hypothetical protein
VAKLRQNNQDAGADFAVLVTAAFPSKLPPKPMVQRACCRARRKTWWSSWDRRADQTPPRQGGGQEHRRRGGEKILDFFAGKGRDVLQSLGRRGERQKQLNQELFRDVNKHIRASDKLADGQANDVRDFTAARGGRGLEVKQRLAPAAIVTRRYLFGGLLSKPMLHQPQASDE